MRKFNQRLQIHKYRWHRFISSTFSQHNLKKNSSFRKARTTGSPRRVSEKRTKTGDFFTLSSRFSSRDTRRYWYATHAVKITTGSRDTNNRGKHHEMMNRIWQVPKYEKKSISSYHRTQKNTDVKFPPYPIGSRENQPSRPWCWSQS